MTTYPTYLSLADTVEYLAASPRATAFLAEDDDTQDRWLVEATREFNAEDWAGTATADDQDLAWPRDGVTGATDGETPQAIYDGWCELVLALYTNASLIDQVNTGNNVKSVGGAGVPTVEFFAPSSETAARYPMRVQRLVGRYLASASAGLTLSVATGTCEESQFDDCNSYDLSRGE